MPPRDRRCFCLRPNLRTERRDELAGRAGGQAASSASASRRLNSEATALHEDSPRLAQHHFGHICFRDVCRAALTLPRSSTWAPTEQSPPGTRRPRLTSRTIPRSLSMPMAHRKGSRQEQQRIACDQCHRRKVRCEYVCRISFCAVSTLRTCSRSLGTHGSNSWNLVS